MKELIAERTGVQPGNMGMYFRLNPRVDDIPERFSVEHNGIRLLVMGKVKKAGTGCYCPESAFIRELIGHLLLEEKDIVIMDMEAGIEHLGRGTSGDVDSFIIVVEPGKRSLETAKRVSELASELGVKSFYIIEQKAGSAGMINPSDIAGGIWVALLTTVAGLCVAIVSYLAYNYFVHKVNTFILEIEQASTELAEILLDSQ